MKLSYSKLTFFALFDILFLLLLLLGESFLGLMIMAGLCCLYLAYSSKLNLNKIGQYQTEFILGLVFVASLITSSFFSHSLPLAIESVIFYFFALATFYFFLLAKDKFLDLKLVLLNILVVTFVLAVLSWSFLFLPSKSTLIPGMNLVYSSYGHNHLAALLIMALPLAWWFYFKNKENKTIFLSLILFLLVTLFTTFGRVAILIGTLQLVFVFWVLAKNKSLAGLHHKAIKVVGGGLGITFLLLVIFKSYLSASSYYGHDSVCPLPLFEDKVCQDVGEERRLLYWGQAVKSLQDNFIFGYGPGTFSLVNQKYRQSPVLNTSYAHSAYLKIFAEGGVTLGLAFLLIMGGLFFRAIPTKKNKLSVETFVFLSLISIYTDVFFDFDWSFSGLFATTFILLALLISGQKERKPFFRPLVSKILYFSLPIFILFLAVLFLLLEIMIKQKKVDQAFDFFPYFISHQYIFLGDPQLSVSDREKLAEIYKYHFPLRLSLMAKSDDLSKKYEVIKQISNLDPWWLYWESNYFSKFTDHPDFLLTKLIEMDEKLRQAQQVARFDPNSELKNKLAKLSVQVADEFYLREEYAKAGQAYLLASKFDNWILSDASSVPLFLSDHMSSSPEELKVVLDYINQIEIKYLLAHTEKLEQVQRKVAKYQLEIGDFTLAKKLLLRTKELAPWLQTNLEMNEGKILQRMADEAVKNNDKKAEEITQLMYELGAYWSKDQLGNYYLIIGDRDRAMQAYEKCLVEWQETHSTTHANCENNLTAVKNNWPENDFYWSTSEIIRTQPIYP